MSIENTSEGITVGIAQIAPVWLNRTRTLAKIIEYVTAAANQECRLVVFGEALLPGYHPVHCHGGALLRDFRIRLDAQNRFSIRHTEPGGHPG